MAARPLPIPTLAACLCMALGCTAKRGKQPPWIEAGIARMLSGQVRGLEQQSARVCAWRTPSHRLTRVEVDTPAACADSKSDGSFMLTLHPGIYDVVADAPGMLPAHAPLALGSELGPTPSIELETRPGWEAIRGRVVDISRRPIAGASVRLFADFPNYHEVVVAHGTTDADGRYELWAADQRVTPRFISRGHARSPVPLGDEVLLLPESVVSGTVQGSDPAYARVVRNHALPIRRPAAEARYYYDQLSYPTFGRPSDAVWADADGHYRLDGLLPIAPFDRIDAATPTWTGHANVKALEFATLHSGIDPSISGQLAEPIQTRIVSPEGTPVPRCSLGLGGDDWAHQWLMSDEDGRIDAPAWTDAHIAKLHCPGHVLVSSRDLQKGVQSQVVVGPGLELHATLVDHLGQPVADQWIYAEPRPASNVTPSSPTEAITDVDGRFTIAGLTRGDFELSARDWPNAPFELAIGDEAPPARVFELPITATLEVQTAGGTTRMLLESVDDDRIELVVRVLDGDVPVANAVVDVPDRDRFARLLGDAPIHYQEEYASKLDWRDASHLRLTDAQGRVKLLVEPFVVTRIIAVRPARIGIEILDEVPESGEVLIQLRSTARPSE